ncbi:interferon-induced protein with tetratricopeptide repeats 5-like [Crotalus adamanteus]|uniref:Interferon-induced protein with tetratricopeptide repeats 5-like n=1 Tax=Crotalus adamanteus TaxID=8729 RepID=A0AAW1BE57_CROAD
MTLQALELLLQGSARGWGAGGEDKMEEPWVSGKGHLPWEGAGDQEDSCLWGGVYRCNAPSPAEGPAPSGLQRAGESGGGRRIGGPLLGFGQGYPGHGELVPQMDGGGRDPRQEQGGFCKIWGVGLWGRGKLPLESRWGGPLATPPPPPRVPLRLCRARLRPKPLPPPTRAPLKGGGPRLVLYQQDLPGGGTQVAEAGVGGQRDLCCCCSPPPFCREETFPGIQRDPRPLGTPSPPLFLWGAPSRHPHLPAYLILPHRRAPATSPEFGRNERSGQWEDGEVPPGKLKTKAVGRGRNCVNSCFVCAFWSAGGEGAQLCELKTTRFASKASSRKSDPKDALRRRPIAQQTFSRTWGSRVAGRGGGIPSSSLAPGGKHLDPAHGIASSAARERAHRIASHYRAWRQALGVFRPPPSPPRTLPGIKKASQGGFRAEPGSSPASDGGEGPRGERTALPRPVHPHNCSPLTRIQRQASKLANKKPGLFADAFSATHSLATFDFDFQTPETENETDPQQPPVCLYSPCPKSGEAAGARAVREDEHFDPPTPDQPNLDALGNVPQQSSLPPPPRSAFVFNFPGGTSPSSHWPLRSLRPNSGEVAGARRCGRMRGAWGGERLGVQPGPAEPERDPGWGRGRCKWAPQRDSKGSSPLPHKPTHPDFAKAALFLPRMPPHPSVGPAPYGLSSLAQTPAEGPQPSSPPPDSPALCSPEGAGPLAGEGALQGYPPSGNSPEYPKAAALPPQQTLCPPTPLQLPEYPPRSQDGPANATGTWDPRLSEVLGWGGEQLGAQPGSAELEWDPGGGVSISSPSFNYLFPSLREVPLLQLKSGTPAFQSGSGQVSYTSHPGLLYFVFPSRSPPPSRPLKEKLQRLQCHFTWDFEVKDKMDIRHSLASLSLRLEHGPFYNRGTYLALKAYLRHLEGSPKEALDILKEAEEVLRKEPQETFSRQVLLVYGNYAWICYHLTDYNRVDLYLGQIRQICRDLSSPEPYSAPIPEVYAQKGWSLLAMGFRNGQLARECFQTALELQESNAELEEGLTFSTFASWTHFYDDKLQEECQKLLEGLIRSQPENYEAKIYLAQILRTKDHERARHLADDVVQNSLNPELLRMAAKVIKLHSTSQAISTLKKAMALQGDHYLLHYDLGIYYLDLLERGFDGNRAEIVEDAIECFKQSLEAEPGSVFSRLKLAKLYGEKRPLYEEEVYLGLMEELPTASKRCQQSFYLHWGDFLLRKKGQRQAALRAYKACLEVPGDHPLEQKQLEQRLRELARAFRSEGETEQERAVQRLLHQVATKRLAR